MLEGTAGFTTADLMTDINSCMCDFVVTTYRSCTVASVNDSGPGGGVPSGQTTVRH
ncbi:MAG: hypothetical protein IT365_04615 [Candidatus Hydrogenedentes bacterium]|nr:hypothetical protein [Candidatus Hydrogenedentota bacterium]